MPELPEVETIRAFLDKHVRGKTITAIDLDLPRLIKNTTADRFQAALTGQTLEGVSRRGKYLFVHCSGPWSFLAHMRMTGSLLYEERPGQYAGRAIHITFTLSEGRLLYRDIRTLGCLWLVPSDGPTGVKVRQPGTGCHQSGLYDGPALCVPERLSSAGEDAAPGPDQSGRFGQHLRRRSPVPGGHPAHAPQRQRDEERSGLLHEAIVAVLQEGLAHGGTTIRNFISGNGKEGQNQENLRVYGREGTPCTVCGTTIEYTKLNGRGTHYCPKCQS